MQTDVIAAIATALSESGIGIIRISGDGAVELADKLFRTRTGRKKLSKVESHTIHYGFIIDNRHHKADTLEEAGAGDGQPDSELWKKDIVDEVMAVVMKAPNTYTREDTVEINCHGGVLMMQRILELVLLNGARLAEPGEFTKRAFLNGRIDLSRAEAVMDVIHSSNEYALAASVSQLKGSLSEEVKQLRAQLLYEIAFIESALDDPEHISLEGYTQRLMEKTDAVIASLQKLILSAENGKLIREGINTVIVGKPNAGKSSLLNILVGEERAIVTEIAGTTRDILQEHIRLHGIGLNVIDTAGIRRTEDVVEKIGVERAMQYAAEADLLVYVVDGSRPLDESDEEILPLLQDKKTIVLLNKSDLSQVVTEEALVDRISSPDVRVIRTSTRENTGIDLFEETVRDMFFQGELQGNDELVITNMRHKEALVNAYESMKLVRQSILDEMPEDFYSIDLMSAYASLGLIIGEEVGEDLVNEIFSKFCMGK